MSDRLFYNNKEYILGATVGPKTGTGGVTYSLSGLCGYKNQEFIIVSYKGNVSSSISSSYVLPMFGEYRDNFVAFAWSWPSPLGAYQWTYQWSTFGNTGGPESGTTLNYYTSSEDLGNTNWFGINALQAKPSWLNVISGITDPFGGTGAYTLNVQGLTTNQFIRYGQYVGGLPAGKTYIMSIYINTSGTTSGWVVHNEWQAAYAQPVDITMRQILPVGASVASGSHRPTINFVNGQTGWQRFAWEFFAQPVTQATGIGGSFVAGLTWENLRSYLMERTFTSGVTANITIYGPQLEEV